MQADWSVGQNKQIGAKLAVSKQCVVCVVCVCVLYVSCVCVCIVFVCGWQHGTIYLSA